MSPDACPKCGEPGGAKARHVCSSRAAVAKYARPSPTRTGPREVRHTGAGMAFRLLICDRCRAVWPTERDEAHGGSRLDGEPCSYTAFGSAPCKGRVWPGRFDGSGADHEHAPPRQEGEWRVGDYAWRKELGLPGDCRDLATVRKRYRHLAVEHHPDRGGDTARMARINEAYAQALAELGQPS